MTELDVPGLIHSAGSCSARESYTLKFINEESIAIISLLNAKIFDKFPTLKIVVSHGGGAISYQMGRFRAWNVRKGEAVSFDDQLKQLYFDTCNYSKEAVELLLKVAGTDNVMFGTEKPGTGSARDPISGRDYDDMKPVIESIEWLKVPCSGMLWAIEIPPSGKSTYSNWTFSATIANFIDRSRAEMKWQFPERHS